MHWADRDGDDSWVAHSNHFSDEQLGAYARFANADPWVCASRRAGALNRATNLTDLVPVRAFENSFFYNEYLRPMGDDTARCAGLMIGNDAGTGIVALQRGLTQESFDEVTLADLACLTPHLIRLMSIRTQLHRSVSKTERDRAMLDCTPCAIILCSPDRRLLGTNGAGEDLLLDEGTLLVRFGRVEPTCGRNATQFAGAIRAASDGEARTPSRLRLFDRAGRCHGALVTPCMLSAGVRGALLTLTPHRQQSTNARAEVAAQWRLTPAETDVALAMAQGNSLQMISRSRGASIETVRSQVKAIGAKLGCTRQIEIVAQVVQLLG